ncbi:hypothetical protein V8G54_013669 [Vigna mungo]|uniref:Oligopeptidase A n=1 Tax=Vigna mungo TaxID=3915 RepID=A0AAQ3RYF0_VIGMU
MRRTSVLGTLLIANLLMATRLSLTFSRSIPPLLLTRTSCSISNLKQFPKSHPCPLWSSSFSFCLHRLHKSTSPLRASSFSSSPLMAASSPNGVIEDNPLLQNFDFPPFDVVEPKHVRPGIRSLLGELERELEDLERNVEPSWPKLVEPLEKIVDRLSVVWGMVNHLKAVKDSSELRSAIEDVQAEKELEKLSQKFGENVLDATKKFEKLITDKKEIEGLPATALGLAAQSAVTKGHENATAENGPWVITLDAPSFIAVMQHARNRSLREEIYRAYVSRASTGDLDNTEIINQILKLRLEKAKLLNYNNYAEILKTLRNSPKVRMH